MRAYVTESSSVARRRQEAEANQLLANVNVANAPIGAQQDGANAIVAPQQIGALPAAALQHGQIGAQAISAQIAAQIEADAIAAQELANQQLIAVQEANAAQEALDAIYANPAARRLDLLARVNAQNIDTYNSRSVTFSLFPYLEGEISVLSHLQILRIHP
jgi:hypothetical protein